MMKKGIFKKLVAAFAIVTVLVYQVLPMVKVEAESRTFAPNLDVTYKVNHDITPGHVEWSYDGGATWTVVSENIYGQTTLPPGSLEPTHNLKIRIIVNEGYSIDWNQITFSEYYCGEDELGEWGYRNYPLSEQANASYAGALQSSQGYMVPNDYNAVKLTNVAFTNNNAQPPAATYNVDFGTASWTIGETTVTAALAGTDLTNGPVQLQETDRIQLTNYNPDTMQVKVSGESGFWTTLTVSGDGQVGLEDKQADNLPNEDLTFVVEAKPGDQPSAATYNVDFGTASWTIGETTVTAALGETNLTNGPIEMRLTDRVQLTNYDSSKMKVKLSGANNFYTYLNVSGDGQVGLEDIEQGVTLPQGTLVFSVEEDEPEQQPVGGNEDIEFDVAFTGTHVNMTINHKVVFDDVDGILKNTFTGTIEEAGTTNASEVNEIKVISVFGDYPIATVTINGTEYTENSPNVTIDLVDGGWIIEVPGAAKYTITGTADTTAVLPRTIIWANVDVDKSSEAYAPDMLLEHGSAGVIAVYDNENQLVDPSTYLGQNSDQYGVGPDGMGWVQIVPGSRVIFEFVPEYGYQLTSVSANGIALEPQDTINQYEFTMPDTNIHFSAEFKPTSDVVKTESDKVRSGKIDVGTNLDGGSAELTIKDIELSPDKIKNFEGAADGYEVSNYLDIDLYNIFYKGKDDADDVWSNKIDELEKEVVITIKLAKGVNGNDIVIVHNIHDGDEYEIIPTVYDAKTNTITFKTKSFSNYAIGSRTVATANPKTGDNFFLYLALLSMSSIGFVLSKKAKNNN